MPDSAPGTGSGIGGVGSAGSGIGGSGNDTGGGIGSDNDTDNAMGGGYDAGAASDAQAAENEAQSEVGAGRTGTGSVGLDIRDLEEQMADPTSTAMDQSVAQAMESAFESGLAAAGRTPEEIAQAMMAFTAMSPQQQTQALAELDDLNNVKSLSKRSIAEQLQAARVQAQVMGLRSLGPNMRGFAMSLAEDVLGLAMATTIGALGFGVIGPMGPAVAAGLQFGVSAVSNMTVDAISKAAHSQAAGGITDPNANNEIGSMANEEGNEDAARLAAEWVRMADLYGNDVVAEGIDIALTIAFGQLYRRRIDIIGSAFDVPKNWFL